MATIDAALRINLFRSSSPQRQAQATPLVRPETDKAPLRELRVGMVIDADRLCDTLPIKAIADRLTAEPGIAKVSTVERATSDYIRQFVWANDLDRLVVGGQYVDWIRMVPTGTSAADKCPGPVVRVVDLGRLCARVHYGEEATAKALLLLLAAVARVRSGDTLSRVSVDEELRVLLGRSDVSLSPRVAVLACPSAFASLRMIGQIGRQYLPGAVPVEIPCHLNTDRQLTARALELGSSAVLSIGCSSGCELGRHLPQGQAKASDSQGIWGSDGEGQPVESITVTRLRDFVDGLDSFLSKVQ